MHVYSEESPIELNGSYSQASMHRVAACGARVSTPVPPTHAQEWPHFPPWNRVLSLMGWFLYFGGIFNLSTLTEEPVGWDYPVAGAPPHLYLQMYHPNSTHDGIWQHLCCILYVTKRGEEKSLTGSLWSDSTCSVIWGCRGIKVNWYLAFLVWNCAQVLHWVQLLCVQIL